MLLDTPSIKAEAAMSVPPAAVATVSVMGYTLSDWVLIATLAWLGLQISWFLYQRYKDFKKK